MKKLILFASAFIVIGLISLQWFESEDLHTTATVQETGSSQFPKEEGTSPLALTPGERLRVLEKLASRRPRAKLRELKSDLERARETYQQRLLEYELLERDLRTRMLASPNLKSDAGIERIQAELRLKLKDLQHQSLVIAQAAAKLNQRLSLIAQQIVSNEQGK